MGPDHLVVAFPVTKLAHIHSVAGDFGQADELFERSMAIRGDPRFEALVTEVRDRLEARE